MGQQFRTGGFIACHAGHPVVEFAFGLERLEQTRRDIQQLTTVGSSDAQNIRRRGAAQGEGMHAGVGALDTFVAYVLQRGGKAGVATTGIDDQLHLIDRHRVVQIGTPQPWEEHGFEQYSTVASLLLPEPIQALFVETFDVDAPECLQDFSGRQGHLVGVVIAAGALHRIETGHLVEQVEVDLVLQFEAADHQFGQAQARLGGSGMLPAGEAQSAVLSIVEAVPEHLVRVQAGFGRILEHGPGPFPGAFAHVWKCNIVVGSDLRDLVDRNGVRDGGHGDLPV
jgi:hypothetical protein